eukprot:NODE_16_length_49026_cov_1.035992.p26 type:complete len:112 gc:universal NODE_16_length_49026_cov_1.035992:43603-43938(+)
MFLITCMIFGMMGPMGPGWSGWSANVAPPQANVAQQVDTTMKNDAEYQRQRGDFWKTSSMVAVPVLGAAALISLIKAAIRKNLHKREILEDEPIFHLAKRTVWHSKRRVKK